eukprot:COSAG01_NODE_12145_length_1794_cov_1.398230_2_plen_239_part_00
MRRARGVHARVTHLRLQPLTKSSLCEIVAVRWHTLVHGADDDELDASFWNACVHIGNLGERWVHDDGAALAELLSSSALGVHVLGVTVRAREGTQAAWALVSLESAQEARSVLAPAAEQAAPQLAGLRRRAVSMVRGPFARTHMCTSSNAPPTPHTGNVLHVSMRGLALAIVIAAPSPLRMYSNVYRCDASSFARVWFVRTCVRVCLVRSMPCAPLDRSWRLHKHIAPKSGTACSSEL